MKILAAHDIFHEAAQIASDDERRQFLDSACAGEAELRQRVQRLLDLRSSAEGFLEDAPLGIASTTAMIPPSEGPGTQIGPYKVLEQIGEGGMGVVYVAEQTAPVRRRVALKVIKPGMDSKQVIARFEAERQALAMMDHPNIARVIDAGTVGPGRRTGPDSRSNPADSRPANKQSAAELDELSAQGPAGPSGPTGRPYFVMELIRGLPITDYCDQARLSTRNRLKLFIDVCHAVQHAHQKGVIHRDLKPSNVMVTLHDGTPVVKVIDFGVAKAMGQQLTERTIYTAHAQLVGTPLYMSPEQAELSGLDVDTRSDVYSLGVLLYELLTGHTPFDKETLSKAGFDEMRRIIREDEPPRPSQRISTLNAQAHSTVSAHRGLDERKLGQALRGELDWIVMKALEKDRDRRYESASALAGDLLHHSNDEPVKACPPSVLYRFRKFAKKHRASLTTASLLAASLLIGTAVSLWQAVRATAAEAQAVENASQAVANEAKAKEQEQKAMDLAAAEAEQRRQAEKNFEAALDAVERMLTNVADPELNGVPRVGPLRSKMLKDTIEFYQRIPIQSKASLAARYRIAHNWARIARHSQDLYEKSQAKDAYETAVGIMSRLADEQPGNSSYRSDLAKFEDRLGSLHYHELREFENAEKRYRAASEHFAASANLDPQNRPQLLVAQAHTLRNLAAALQHRGKREEAIGSIARALDLLDQSGQATGYDRAKMLAESSRLRLKTDPNESDALLRRAVVEFRGYLSGSKKSVFQRSEFGSMLHDIANRFAQRYPDEAEQYWDESIACWRELCDPDPVIRIHAAFLTKCLIQQARHLRSLAARDAPGEAPEIATNRLEKAERLFQEAIKRQRRSVELFAQNLSSTSSYGFMHILREEAVYLLRQADQEGQTQPQAAANKRLQADAFLTESIQVCRKASAEFPDNADYKSRLASLEKLHAQHFGQKPKEP